MQDIRYVHLQERFGYRVNRYSQCLANHFMVYVGLERQLWYRSQSVVPVPNVDPFHHQVVGRRQCHPKYIYHPVQQTPGSWAVTCGRRMHR